MTIIEELLLVFGMMLVTYGVRYPVLALSSRIQFPAVLENALRFVPVAVLTAITVPILMKPDGQWWLSVGNEYLVAGIAAIVIAAMSRHLLLTIVLGMGVFLLLRVYS